jgi:hypothetical protein
VLKRKTVVTHLLHQGLRDLRNALGRGAEFCSGVHEKMSYLLVGRLNYALLFELVNTPKQIAGLV